VGPTGDRFRILQVHPTLRCNLRCLHCYSSSGPEHRDGLDGELLRSLIRDAAGEGFNVASFSGGEPLMYPGLPELLDVAHECGMGTSLVTNGMLLSRRRLETLQGRLDVVAISLDGVPASHDRIRGSERAFEIMASRIDGLRGAGIPFGFVFTLTRANLDELGWVCDFAVAHGARLLQIHPLEEVGRARSELQGLEPDDQNAALAWLAAIELRKLYGDRISIQLDLVDGERLRALPASVFADDGDALDGLTELVSPLIVEADGTVVPLQYGFPREYALGNLHDAPLQELTERWQAGGLAAFRSLCRRTFEELTVPTELPIFNWYQEVARRAEAALV
jgi:MoaA/NifB/PqqE/SkfB family radical SAM enzyme